MSTPRLSYVDLFAGAGGLSLGLEKAGFEPLHAVEMDDDARSTYANNREKFEPEDLSEDIREVDTAEIPELVGEESVDLVAGGPPCQGFSEVVSPDGSDDRNHLFTYFIQWVNELQPKAALFENVRGMEKTDNGRFFEAVKESFDNIGYEVVPQVVTASDFGVPQHRRRLIVLAFRGDAPAHSIEGFEIDPVETPGVIDGIGDLPEVGAGEEVTEYDKEPGTVLQDDLRNGSEKLTHHKAANHTQDMVEMISHISDGGNRTEIPDELAPTSGYHNSYSRLDSQEPAVAITSNMSKPSSARCIHPFQNRGLTPREGARLQTFPDSYHFDGGLVSIRKQIGNAVPPYLGEALGYYLKEAVYELDLTEADQERLRTIRCGSLPLDQFEQEQDEIGGLTKQATLDNLT
ncbi:DNA cytosine methyltransferase [Haloarcula pellucida]|uniref:DNA (cytosine-5-)-methyltransferase n=1 Tax=Haloarcula pellucida TaxID=1427151 RepID=A0A830GK25_9EURY|nr:DNA cytosine methyltransferase [Halomicroarcula pellucida]MBX0348562.1 DNA cytosine methyltransferase [Halomicroarcula pellucida]GGN92831.1 cytosine-specific methyltransferase [Halomicroarcula pellucida]